MPEGPRTTTTERVLITAFHVLIAEGAHALTPQRLHQETGVARTTIYRNWPTTADLLAAMLERATSDRDLPQPTGHLPTDLRHALDLLVFRCNHRPLRALYGALIEHGRRDGGADDLAARYTDGLLRSMRHAIAEGVDAGVLTGDPEDLVHELAGPILTRHVLLGLDVDTADAHRVLHDFLRHHGVDDLPDASDLDVDPGPGSTVCP